MTDAAPPSPPLSRQHIRLTSHPPQGASGAPAIRWGAADARHPVIEFGLRRAQGIDGAMAASRAAYVGGCVATSNLLAGKMLGIPVRVGAPTDLTGLSDTIDSPPYATGVGLLRWGARHGLAMLNSPSTMSDRNGLGSAYERFKGWLREFLP